MARRFYPHSRRDRWTFWLAVAIGPFAALELALGEYGWAVFEASVALFGLVGVYAFQDQPPASESDRYSAVSDRIKTIGSLLSNLNVFLEEERSRVADTESVLRKLRLERAALEPVVLTQRERVDAILAEHSRRQAVGVWKERVFGFFGGVIASLVAAVVHDLLGR